MTTRESLLIREAELLAQLQALGSSLADVRVHIAEMEGINRNAITYNLPVETLSTIFEIGLSDSPFLATKSKRHFYMEDRWSPLPTPFEIVVSSVSRRWRNVALQTPRLWTRIYINVAQSAHELLDLYLCRSKICLLDITLSRRKLRWERNCDPFVNDAKVLIECKRYLEQLVPYVRRWRELSIRRDDCGLQLSDALAGLANMNAPALETLMLEGYSGSFTKVFSGGAARLSSVELIGVLFSPPPEAVKHLKLYPSGSFQLSHAQFRRLIQPMHSLVNLHLQSGVVVESPTGHPLIDLPSVISLEIDLLRSHGKCVLPVLDLPSVETLTIHAGVDNAIESFTYIPRLYLNLRFLKIIRLSEYSEGAKSPVDTAQEFISLFPSVRDVTFHGADPTPIFLALDANRQSTDELLWPQLSSVTVIPAIRARVTCKKQIWANIVKLVGERAQLGHPISSVKLSLEVVVRGTQRQQQRMRDQVTLIEC